MTVRRTRIVLLAGQWVLIAGLVFYSLMTTTPLVAAHSEWTRSGWVLGLIVDVAFIMALTAESTLAEHGIKAGGKWPFIFRWFTGLAATFLNIWSSASARDWVGVAIHLVTPALVMILAEVGPVFMRHLREAESASAAEAVQPTAIMDDSTADARITFEADPEVPPAEYELEAEPEPEAEPQPRLPKAEAAKIIHDGWVHKVPPEEVAPAATRSASTVRAHYRKLDAELAA